MDVSEIRWADAAGRRIAYQTVGSGPPDVLYLDAWFTNLDSDWDDPLYARFMRRLGASLRLIRFDKSGTGLSDRVVPAPEDAIQTWIEDAIAVLDALDAARVHLVASSWCGPLGVTLAAVHPERIDRLVLYGTFARIEAGPDNPGAVDPTLVEAALQLIRESWGTGVLIDILGIDHSPRVRSQMARYERSAASHQDIAQLAAALVEADARPLLSKITMPTLVIHVDNPILVSEQAEFLSSQIPGARMASFTRDGWSWRVAEDDLGAETPTLIEFLTGSVTERDLARRVAVMVFIDVVSSTPLAARLGDREWTDVLGMLHESLEVELGRFRGRLVGQSGDGFFCELSSASRAVSFAVAMVAIAEHLNAPIRVGIHVGECQVNGDDLSGVAVHAAARIMSLASASEVLVSSLVRDLADDGVAHFDALGEHELRGVPGTIALHRLER